MAVAVARIKSFVEKMEQQLAPPPDRTKWVRIMNSEPGETREATMQRHLQEHPEDRAMAQWLAWIWTGVPRGPGSYGETISREQSTPDYVMPAKTEPVCRTRSTPVENATPSVASPTPEPKRPEPEPEKPARHRVWDSFSDEDVDGASGFGRRLHYGPSGF